MKDKTKTEQQENQAEEDSYLKYTIHRLVIIVKDGGRVHIDNLMSGKPKDEPKP